jgi:outer membrane immunogenic protein
LWLQRINLPKIRHVWGNCVVSAAPLCNLHRETRANPGSVTTNTLGQNLEGMNMKKLTATLLLSVAAIAAVSGSAMAADLMVPQEPAPVMAAPSTNWDGPYIGASLGFIWAHADLTDTGGGEEFVDPNGFIAGAQIGYNFHLSDMIVGGIEGNIDWVSASATNADDYTVSIGWEGSVRARLGIDAGQFLPYIEAGVAFANETNDWSGSDVTQTVAGWTAGVGVEFALADNLTANLEYRYSDYGTATIDANNSIHLTDNSVRVGLNYHF